MLTPPLTILSEIQQCLSLLSHQSSAIQPVTLLLSRIHLNGCLCPQVSESNLTPLPHLSQYLISPPGAAILSHFVQASPWTLISDSFTHELSVSNTSAIFRLTEAAPCVLACLVSHIIPEMRFSTIRSWQSSMQCEWITVTCRTEFRCLNFIKKKGMSVPGLHLQDLCKSRTRG